MFKLAIILALVALAAAVLGFGGIAGALADVALFVFVIALIAAVLFFVLGWSAARRIMK